MRLERFLKNPRVTTAEMVAAARRHLRERVRGRAVPVIQDTTSPRDDGRKRGLYPHAAIVADAVDGALLGPLAANVLVRDETPKVHCDKRGLDEKESRRWVRAAELAADLAAAGAARVTPAALNIDSWRGPLFSVMARSGACHDGGRCVVCHCFGPLV